MPQTESRILNPALGLFFAAASALSLATSNLMVKLVSDTHDGLEVGFYRHLFGLFAIFVFIAATGGLEKLKTPRLKTHALRAFVGTAAMVLMFSSLAYLPTAEMTVLFFSGPLFVVALSWPVLKEKVGIYRTAATICGFAGILLIIQPGTISSLTGGLLALSAGFCMSLVILLLRHMGKTEPAETTVFYFAAFGLLMLAPVMPFVWTVPTVTDMLFFAAIGVNVTIGQLFLTRAYIYATAATAAPVNYTMLIWALLYDSLFFNILPQPQILVGAVIVISSNLVILYREQHAKQKS